MNDEEMVSVEISPLDFSSGDPVTEKKENRPATDKEREQLNAYRKCFDALHADLEKIEERHKNDAQPNDSEATRELKAVRQELQELKDALSRQQPQPQYFQPQQPPQMMYSAPFSNGFNVPYMQTPNFQPTIPNLMNIKNQ